MGPRPYGPRVPSATPITIGTSPYTALAFTLPVPGLLVKVTAYLDGLGSGVGNGVLQAGIYQASGPLVAPGATSLGGVPGSVTIPSGQAPSWVDVGSYAAAELAAGDYVLVLSPSGGASSVIRAYRAADATTGGLTASSPGSTLGSTTADNPPVTAFVTFTDRWQAPSTDDFHYARLPYAEAFSIFDTPTSNADVPAAVTAACGWHGTARDPETDYFAIANRDNEEMTALVGERIRVHATTEYGASRYIPVYVHRQADILEDISLTRRAFARLAPLSTETLSVEVEVIP